MATLKQDKERADRGTYLPEHGPIDEKSGKEILLSLKNVDITFGKGEAAVRAVQNATFDIYKGETFSLERPPWGVRLSGLIHWLVGKFSTRAYAFPVRFHTLWTGRSSEIFRWYFRILPHL